MGNAMANRRKLIDLTGQTFGQWRVLRKAADVVTAARPSGRPAWECVCACGNITIVQQRSLLSGGSQCCGCVYRAKMAQRNQTHGLSHLPEYRIWGGIIQRTENPNSYAYADYGGRGITVSPEWRSCFEQFYADMGDRPSPEHEIDRIDNDGPYSKQNCRWATLSEQARNRRTNRWITYNGETLCLADWAKRLGTGITTIQRRFDRGWSIERALTTRTDGEP